jgi:hypothetical protein
MGVSGFTTVPYVAAVGNLGVCATGDVSAFVTACGVNGSQTTCDNWQNTNLASDAGPGTACGNCIFAPMNNGGTWTDVNGYFLPNYAGCIQLTDPSSAGTACATALDDRQGCEGLACDMCTSGKACITAVDSAGCSQYVSAFDSSCTSELADGGAVPTCFPGGAANPDLDLSYVVTLICGGGDGGTPTTDSGVADAGAGG